MGRRGSWGPEGGGQKWFQRGRMEYQVWFIFKLFPTVDLCSGWIPITPFPIWGGQEKRKLWEQEIPREGNLFLTFPSVGNLSPPSFPPFFSPSLSPPFPLSLSLSPSLCSSFYISWPQRSSSGREGHRGVLEKRSFEQESRERFHFPSMSKSYPGNGGRSQNT